MHLLYVMIYTSEELKGFVFMWEGGLGTVNLFWVFVCFVFNFLA